MKYTCPCCQATFEIDVTVTPLVVPKVAPKRAKAPMTELKRFGEYQHIVLTESEYEELLAMYGVEILDKIMLSMDRWVEMKKKPYKKYKLAIQDWVERELLKNPYLKEKLPVKEERKAITNWEE